MIVSRKSLKRNTKEKTNQSREREFYKLYSWCLNPYLTLKEQFRKTIEITEQYNILDQQWQKNESILNIYLLLCAITCTIDDYLAWHPVSLFTLVRKYPKIYKVILIVERLINIFYRYRHYKEFRRFAKWRDKWNHQLEHICSWLISNYTPDDLRLLKLKAKIEKLIDIKLPEELLKWKMKINEGFRCQDLTHLDIIRMAEQFTLNFKNTEEPIIVIGPRTAGAYFAPIIKVFLKSKEYKIVQWITVRPAFGLSSRESRWLNSLLKFNPRIIVTDDYPNTGFTINNTLKILYRYGADPARIILLVPTHPVSPDWFKFIDNANKLKHITLFHNHLFKSEFIYSENIKRVLADYFTNYVWDSVKILKSSEVQKINEQFENSYQDGFQVRVKHLFEVQLTDQENKSERKKILVKSVGWGWLGYHAYLIQSKLDGFVAEVIGLRNGLLFIEWLDRKNGSAGLDPGKIINKISEYIVKRVHTLKLNKDPKKDPPEYGWGWLEILALLRRPYGVNSGRLKDKILLNKIQRSLQTMPVITDGRMSPEEWIETDSGLIKTDFEQHNFGPPEFDIVDPAYDLAASVFEFHLSEESENWLINNYLELTGDINIDDRILAYKLLYGSIIMRKSAEIFKRTNQNSTRMKYAARYISAWNFLVFTLQKFCSQLLPDVINLGWTSKLFFMDIDGVFDCEIFGFPHTTLNGLSAISLLKKNGYSIVLNTGRSVTHVNKYTSYYRLPGGIAEYGSVFVDAVNEIEYPLIDKDAESELKECKMMLETIPGIILDNSYRYSVRAFRIDDYTTKNLNEDDIKYVLQKLNCKKLEVINRKADTYFVQQGKNKGTALNLVKKKFGDPKFPVAAIGDSDEDIRMLEESDISFAPGNCSKRVRRLSRKGKCKVTFKKKQSGLLSAVGKLSRVNDFEPENIFTNINEDSEFRKLMFNLLHVADRSKFYKILRT